MREWEDNASEFCSMEPSWSAAIPPCTYTHPTPRWGAVAKSVSFRHHRSGRFLAGGWLPLLILIRQRLFVLTQGLTSPQGSVLSTQNFLDLVLTAEPSTAVFDCDGTLWSGDAGSEFMRWSMDSGLLSREACDWMATRYRGYLRGEVSELAICGEMVQIYRDLRESELRVASRRFFERVVRPRIFPEMQQLCEILRSRGVVLWAVSSTNNWLIEEGVCHLGIPPDRVLATRVRVANGLITQDLVDVPTGEGKAESLNRSGLAHPDAVFGNSIHDAAMLAIAKRPFVVNPTAALSEYAAAHGWPIYQPKLPLA